MLTGATKVTMVFMHILFSSLFVWFSFAMFGLQSWLPYFIGVVLTGIGMYILFILGCVMMMEYFDERGEFSRYENEEEK